jgi:putative transposase
MIDKFQNKYRIPSARLHNWDYGDNGAYFITICTSNRNHFFGEITNDIMELNEIGNIAENFWVEIPQHYPFIELGNYIVMPDHIHGILIINKTKKHPPNAVIVETPKLGVSTNLYEPPFGEPSRCRQTNGRGNRKMEIPNHWVNY